eukprot:341559_1
MPRTILWIVALIGFSGMHGCLGHRGEGLNDDQLQVQRWWDYTWYLEPTDTNNQGRWDVNRVKFILSNGEELNPNNNSYGCSTHSSAQTSWGVNSWNAFEDNGKMWGGMTNGIALYIGVICNNDYNVAAVELDQSTHTYANKVQFNKKK